MNNRVMEEVRRRGFIQTVVTPALLITLIMIAWNSGKALQRIESLTFDSAKQKTEVIALTENHMSEVEVYKFKNSVTELELKQVKFQSDVDEMKATLERIEKQLKNDK